MLFGAILGIAAIAVAFVINLFGVYDAVTQ
jgi:hypothetical protein